jgi:peptidoglycan/LPS O-acetylase OafA/YrhL
MTEGSRFRADVEGLRAVAVLAVVAYHAGLGWVGGGFVGVDVFYVVSGFLITGLLWEELRDTGRLRFAAFYARRARRLLPASALVLVVTVVASSAWLSPLRARVVTGDAAAAALYVANYRFAAQGTDYLAERFASPIQHYWSLGVEEQFYLLWPLLLLGVFLAGRRLRWTSPALVATVLALAGAGSFALSLRLTSVSEPWAFFSLSTRAWELAAGGVVALSVPRLRRLPGVAAAALGWLGLGEIVWSTVRLNASTPFPGTAALLPVGGTVAVIAAGCAAPRLGPSLLLGTRLMRLGGRLSYSWYLWHWPLLILAPAMVGHALGLPWNLGLAAASGLLALATVKLVEDPVRFSARLRTRPGRSLALGAGLTAVAVVAAVGTAAVLPNPNGHGQAAAPRAITVTATPGAQHAAVQDPAEARLESLSPPIVQAVARAVGVRTVPANLTPSVGRAHADQPQPVLDGCLVRWLGVRGASCRYGAARSRTSVVLFGDSDAAMWFPALDRVANANRWRLEALTKVTCPPVELSFWSPVLGRPYRECDQWRANMLQRIRAERPSVVVLGAARHYGDVYHFQVYGPAWISGLAKEVRLIRATGARVVVLGPTPKPAVDVPDCLSAHLSNAVACLTPRADAVNAAGLRAERQAALQAGGSYLDITPWLCTKASCAVMVGNLLAYRDDNHLSTTFTQWVSPVLGSALQETLGGVRPAAGGTAASTHPPAVAVHPAPKPAR